MKTEEQEYEQRFDKIDNQIEKIIKKLTEQLHIKDKTEFKYLMSRLISLIYVLNHLNQKHFDNLIKQKSPNKFINRNKKV